jgi:hypothetical protein
VTTLEVARAAARTFLATHDLPAELVAQLDDPPLLGPVTITVDGLDATAYRWLGSGRGETYVQVAVGPDAITVHGARGDSQLPTMTLPAREPRGAQPETQPSPTDSL